jgi:hypothetical protein
VNILIPTTASIVQGVDKVSDANDDLDGEHVIMKVDPGAEGLRLRVVLPRHYMFVPDQHHHLHIASSDEEVVYVPPFDIPDTGFDWFLPLEVRGEGDAVLHVQGQVFFCPVSDATICIWATIDDRFHVRVEPGASRLLELVHEVDLMECLEHASAARTTHNAVVDEN